jgi:hypothetical protein
VTQVVPAAFFSYCREDSDFALRLAGDLKAAGASVWLDQLDIVPGQRWDRAVEDALANCARMLVILSPASVNSTNVMDEVSFALEEKKTVIPVMYRDCTVPFRLRRVQYVDFRQDHARGLMELLQTLEQERKQAAEQARHLEEDGKMEEQPLREPERTQKPFSSIVFPSVPDDSLRLRLFSKVPVWARIVVASCGILIVASVLYWTSSRQTSAEQAGGTPPQQAKTEVTEESEPSALQARVNRERKQSQLEDEGRKALKAVPVTAPPPVPPANLKDKVAETPKGSSDNKPPDESVVNDPVTALMWTRNDNGKDVNWFAAQEYCRILPLGGYSGWRLPTIDELEKLYDPKDGDKNNIRKPFRLTDYFLWSSTKQSSDSTWFFYFPKGKRDSYLMSGAGRFRALCVRRSGE